MIDNLLAYLKKNFHGQKVIYRSSVAGHPNCERAQGPYSDRLYPHEEYWYNWSNFSDHNAMWKASLESLGDEKYSYLDIEEMTRVRPDGHLHPSKNDCLHYCLPGVIDYWNFMLLAYIASDLTKSQGLARRVS